MSSTIPHRPTIPLDVALESLVARGTITVTQRDAILAEVSFVGPAATAAPAPQVRPRRSLTDLLVEVGAYVGSALVLAALVALVAQSWEDLGQAAQTAILAGTAVVTAVAGWLLSRGAQPGSARRRLAGVVMVGTAASAAGAVALLLGAEQRDDPLIGVLALATAFAVMVVARVLAASAVTEIGLFVTGFALLNMAGDWLRPEGTLRVDEYGNQYTATDTYDALLQLGGVAFGLLWALIVARWLMHRELAVALGVGVAFVSALPLAGTENTRLVGLSALAVLAAVGFWRFMVEGYWPWLAAAIASVTAFVFWLVGVDHQPALAFLVAGLVLLGSSAVGWQVARRRSRAALASGPPPASPSG